jgi:hypothetical protein
VANLLEYDIRVIGRRALEAEFASIERRLAAHNAAVARVTGSTSGRPRSGSTGSSVAAEARAAAAAQRQQAQDAASSARSSARAEIAAKRQVAREAASLARQQRQQEDYWAKARLGSLRLQHREEQQAHRRALAEKRREERKQDTERKRDERRSLATARQEARERVSFVQSTLGGTAGRVGRTLSGVGTMGLAAVGIGGTALAAGAISQATKLDEGSRRLAIQGRDAGQAGVNPDDLRRQFTRVGIATGLRPEDVMAGAAAYTTETGDLKTATQNMQTFAVTAQAAGANVEDIARAAAHMRKIGITSVEDMQKALATLTMQGKKGSYEIRAMATEFPEVMSTAAKMGITGVEGLTKLGGFLQVVQSSTGNASETTTASSQFFNQLVAKSGDLESGEALGGKSVKVFQDKGKTKFRDFRELIGDVLVASRGNVEQINDLFEIRGSKAFNPFTTAFNNRRDAALKVGASKNEADQLGRQAAISVLDNAANVPGDFSEVQRDASDAMKSWSVQVAILETQLKDVISTQVFPELVKMGPSLKDLVPAVATATRAFVSVAKFFAENPLTGIGAIIAAQIAMDVGKAQVGRLLGSLIERFFGGARVPVSGGGAVGGGAGTGGASVSTGNGSRGWGRGGRGAGTVFGRPGLAGAGAAAGVGLLTGASVATGIYTTGIAEFEAGEDRMAQSGRELNQVRHAGVGDIASVKEQIDAKRKTVSRLKRTSVFDDIGEGMFSLFGGGPSSRQVELNTENNFLAEMEKKLAELETKRDKGGEQAVNAAPALQEMSDGAMGAAKDIAALGKEAQLATAELAKLRADAPNRTKQPSQAKI